MLDTNAILPDTACQSRGDSETPDANHTHFDFRNRVFAAPGACFTLKQPGDMPSFSVDLGDLVVLIDIAALKRQFEIEDNTHDARLIEIAVKGLKYVPGIRPGDRIPSELLDGRASWKVDARHIVLADRRIRVQLLSWLSRKEVVISDPDELAMFLDQIENKEKLRTAFGEAALALGLAASDTGPVIARIEMMAREICYIEALRERYQAIPQVVAKLTRLQQRRGIDSRTRGEIQRILTLTKKSVEEYSKLFAEVDAQTGEIISALKSIDRQIGYIRAKRDDLHALMMRWDPIIAAWDDPEIGQPQRLSQIIALTYRFLAQRYSASKSLLRKENPVRNR
jgi:hypothetical protein